MTAPPLRNRRVLIVEDEYFIAMQLQRDLAAAGAVVLGPVPSVAKALALIAAELRIDAAVVDVNLGGEMSFPVADALLARSVSFVFATGYTDGNLCARYPQIPRCDKPFDFPTLERMLASIM